MFWTYFLNLTLWYSWAQYDPIMIIYKYVNNIVKIWKSVLIDNQATTSTLNIPLQKLDTISSFVLTTTIQVDTNYVTTIDTIDFYHTNEQEFISLECGCIVTNSLVGVAQTTNRIDSVVIVSPEVNLQSGNNIKIYLSQR